MEDTNSYNERREDRRLANIEINGHRNSSVLLDQSSNNVVKVLDHYVARSNKEGNLLGKNASNANKLNHAFVSGLLRSFNDPYLYMWNNGEYLVSQKKIGFPYGYDKICNNENYTDDMKNTALIYEIFSDKVDKSNKDYDDATKNSMLGFLLNNNDLKYNKIVADLLCIYFFLGFTDRRADNMLYDEKTKQSINIDYDVHSVHDGKGYFLFHKDEQLEKRECYLQDCFEYFKYFSDVLENPNDQNLGKYKDYFSEKKRNELKLCYKSFLEAVRQKINDFTLNDEDKIKKIIKNTAKFGYTLEIGKKDLKEFIFENLKKFKEYIEYRERFLSEMGDQFFSKEIKEMLAESLKDSRQVLEKVDKNLDTQVDKIVNECYSELEKYDCKERKELRRQIAATVNQRLGRIDPNKQKKLYWTREEEGCEDGKLLNTRFFLKENAGYISQINNYYDQMCDQGKQNFVSELKGLLDLAQTAPYRPTSACY